MFEKIPCLCLGALAIWKIQYSGWQTQHGGQSRGVKNLIKGGIPQTAQLTNQSTTYCSPRC